MTARQGYLIDAKTETVTPVTFQTLTDLQALVGGYIEAAFVWDNGDTLFVDEEGLLKSPQSFFWLKPERADQMLAGNGVLVGPEVDDPDAPCGYTSAPPRMTIEALRKRIFFVKTR